MWCVWEALYLPKTEQAQCDDWSKRVTYVCIQYVIQYLIQSGLHTSSHVYPIAPCAIVFLSCSHPVPQAHSILRCRSHSSGAIVLLTFHILSKQPSLYKPSFSIGHQLLVSPMIENEVVLASEKVLSQVRLTTFSTKLQCHHHLLHPLSWIDS
jgi:hypothetical protein